MRTHSLLLPFALGLAACGGDAVSSARYSGAQSAALGAAGNQADCALCHDNGDAKRSRSGSSFVDIAYHSSFKGGGAPTLLDAANACITGWMGGTALTAADASWKDLEAYLQSLSDSAVTAPNPLAPEVLADDAAYGPAYGGGDATQGQAKYAAACGSCHDHNLKLGPATSYPKATLKGFGAARIAQKVRTSGPPPSTMVAGASDSTPGPMPFYEPSDLSGQDLKDIIAYILQ
jgi:mono/diheme cytochrome c family protein